MYLVSFVVAILSGWLLNSIQSASLRKPISLVMGLLIQVYMYGKGKPLKIMIVIRLGFIPSTSYVIISYLVMWLFPRNVSHYIVFVVNAALLSATHIHKMIYYDKFWGADITAVMMLNLCKISAIAINYRDGSVPVAKRDTELKPSMILIIIKTLI